jgi:hypothetical protein
MNNARTEGRHMNSEIPLPPTAQVVADVIGREATLALAMSCLYRCLYVPKGKLGPDSYLVRTIGEEKAKLMQKEFIGMLLPLATCHQPKQALIRAKIQQLKTQQHANA